MALKNLLVRCGADFSQLHSAMKKASVGAKSMEKSIQQSSGNMNSAFLRIGKVAASAFSVYKLISFGKESISMASDITEVQNVVDTAFGSMSAQVDEWAKTTVDKFGMSQLSAKQTASTYMAMSKSMGMYGQTAADMAIKVAERTADVASFYNITQSEVDTMLKSIWTGETESLKRIGVVMTQTNLNAYAMANGIGKSVDKMSQAEKVQLRYKYVMEQTNLAAGDFAKTSGSWANQTRILSERWKEFQAAIGGLLVQVLTPALQLLNEFMAALISVGNKLRKVMSDAFGWDVGSQTASADATNAMADAQDNLAASTAKAAKEAKKAQSSFDELNVLSKQNSEATDTALAPDASGAGSSVAGSLGGAAVGKQLDGMSQKLKSILTTVGAIGAGFLAWKLSNKLIGGIEYLKSLKSSKFSWGFQLLGVGEFCADLDRFRKALKDIAQNGANFSNVTSAISEFAGLLGDSLMMLGKVEWAAPLKAVQGIGKIVSAIANMANNGINVGNALTVVDGVALVAMAIGLKKKNFKLAGVAGAVRGVTTVIQEIANNWEAIKNGDWSGIDKVTMATAAIEMIGGVVTAIKGFSDTKKAVDTGKAVTGLKEVSVTIGQVGNSTSQLTGKMTSLVKNLGLGIAVIAEVTIAAGLIVSAIWGLGVLLEQVGNAWQPVLDNAGTVAIAMGVGIGLLAGIGVATGLLGTVGQSIAGKMGLGIAILVELGIAAGLFIAEIWAIGWGLDQIGIAWQPVIDNGETIATAIGIGTALLIGVGVVTAALGVATVASAGLLPLAIGLGTAMLVELGAATLLFIGEIWAIGKGLGEVGQAWQPVLDNGKTISKGIEAGTELLIAIGVVTAALGVASVASVGLLPLAIGLGTKLLVNLGDAVVRFNSSLVKVAKSLGNKLHPALKDLNDKLPKLSKDMDSFTKFMKFFAGQVVSYSKSSAISGFAATVDSIIKFFTKDPIKAMADDVNNQYKQAKNLNSKLREANPELETAIRLMGRYYDFLKQLEQLTGKTSNISLANGMFVSMKEVGKNLVIGFVKGIKSEMNTLSKAVKSLLEDVLSDKVARNYGSDFGKRLADGLASGFKNAKFPTLKGNVNIAKGGAVNLKLQAYASGGFPAAGQMFIANEAGPELVGTIGGHTAVANNDQIVESVSQGVYAANTEQNNLLREQNNLLRKLVDKDPTVKAVISTSEVIGGIQRKNRRDGKTAVPVGV